MKTFKKTIASFSILMIASLLSVGLKAQSMYGDAVKADVKMNYVYSFEEALKKAKKENKLIFFNCFADWAVPCHSMNKIVFSDEQFCKFMDKKFVNFYIDVTKTTEGKALAKKYDIKSFAQYLVLDSNGNVVHKIVGGKKLPEFKDDVVRALNKKTSYAGTKAKYESGRYSKEDFKNYLIALNLASDTDKFKELFTEYSKTLSAKDYLNKDNWSLIKSAVRDADSPVFKNVLANKSKIEKGIGEQEVNEYISNIFGGVIVEYAAGSSEYNPEKLLDVYTEMQKADLPEQSLCFLLYDIAKLRGEGKFKELIELFESDIERFSLGKYSMIFSLNKPNMTQEQNNIVADYFTRLAEKEDGKTKSQLLEAAKELLNGGKENLPGVKFHKGDFASALKRAEIEGKLVFLDCYTTWCGPCQMMTKQVFTKDKVGELFNQRFVNIKIDMEKGEGKELMKKYKIQGFPTLLILDHTGKELYRMLGARYEPQLLKEVNEFLETLK